MWFYFGFITFISFTLYSLNVRYKTKWSGEEGEYNGIRYQYKINKIKGDSVSLYLGIDCKSNYNFVLKKEAWFDRIFKTLGLTIEHQVGSDEFDDAIYIISDDHELHGKLIPNLPIIDNLLDLFEPGYTLETRPKKIICESGLLWIMYLTPSNFKKTEIDKVISLIVPKLLDISKELNSELTHDNAKLRDPFIFKSIILLAISSGLALTGLFNIHRLYRGDIPQTLDSWPLFFDSLILGTLIITILVGITLKILYKTSRIHLVLIELLFIGSFGAVSTSYAQLRDLNIEWDNQNHINYIVNVEGIKTTGGGRSKIKYYLIIDDLDKRFKTNEIRVSKEIWKQSGFNSKITLQVKQGFMGYRWIQSVEMY